MMRRDSLAHMSHGPLGVAEVEQEARLSDPETGAERGQARAGSQFVVTGAAVAYHQRHESLDRALAAAGLHMTAEVSSR
jgi:hypothetical protein